MSLPSQMIVNGRTTYIRTQTPAAPNYTCTYAYTIVFSDGTRDQANGQTDPPANMTEHHVGVRTWDRAVTSAQIGTWSCSRR